MIKAFQGGQRTLDGIELFERHVEEFREKIQTFKDIRQVIVANLGHQDQRNKALLKRPSQLFVSSSEEQRGLDAEVGAEGPLIEATTPLKRAAVPGLGNRLSPLLESPDPAVEEEKRAADSVQLNDVKREIRKPQFDEFVLIGEEDTRVMSAAKIKRW